MTGADDEARTPVGEAPDASPAVPPAVGAGGHDPYRALRFRDFRLLLIGVCIGSFGQ